MDLGSSSTRWKGNRRRRGQEGKCTGGEDGGGGWTEGQVKEKVEEEEGKCA